METISVIFIFPVFLIALGTIYLVTRLIAIKAPSHQYAALDGLRGFLALSVFLHHAPKWYYLTHFHRWVVAPSILYFNLGIVGVSFFFMITALLFFSKLMEAAGGEMDWTKLYVSRVLRIMPLYLIAIISLFILVGILSHFTLREPSERIFIEWLKWLFFVHTDINAAPETGYVILAVQWSLAYEWFFYFTLPIIGYLFFKIKTPRLLILVTGLFLALFLFIILRYHSGRGVTQMSPFLGGIAAAFLVKNEKIRSVASSRVVVPVLLLSLFVVLYYCPVFFQVLPFLSIVAVFIALACGNDLFGLLNLRVCRLLGQISYSIYLLHPFVLYIVFQYIIGFNTAGKLSLWAFWLVIAGCACAVTVVCSLTYYFIERPCLKMVNIVAKKIKSVANYLPKEGAQKMHKG